MRRLLATAALAAAVLANPSHAQTRTDTTSFQVKLTITESCDIHTTAATEVNFGSRARTAAAVSIGATGSVTVNCSPNTGYNIGLDGGSNASVTPGPGDRRMKGTNNGALVPYDLYQDAANTVFWGNSTGSLVSGSGTGSNQVYQVHGLLTSLNFGADVYADTVTATISY